jgi:hypothetical protein
MNVKAERMEQMIQVINRNLQLIFCGEQNGELLCRMSAQAPFSHGESFL